MTRTWNNEYLLNVVFWYQDDLVYKNPSCMPIIPQHMPYQGSSNPTFQDEKELSPIKEQIFNYMDAFMNINFQI